MTAFILMGVSGSGKSTIGRQVAQSLGLPFIEGDDFHPPHNVAKMAGGTPLDEDDRAAWIDTLMQAYNARSQRDAVIACSALTRAVRASIQARSNSPVVFLHLTTDPVVIEQRLLTRGHHFMKAGMLPSQLAALESGDEVIPIDAAPSFPEVCAAVEAKIMSLLT